MRRQELPASSLRAAGAYEEARSTVASAGSGTEPLPIAVGTPPSVKHIAAFSPTLMPMDTLSPQVAHSMSSPGKVSGPTSLSAMSLASLDEGRSGLGSRTNSTDDLAAEVLTPPTVNTVSDARLLYRQWRKGPHMNEFAATEFAGESPKQSPMNHVDGQELDHPFSSFVGDHAYSMPPGRPSLDSTPLSHPSDSPGHARQPIEMTSPVGMLCRSPEQLPCISEKPQADNTPLFANAYDPDIKARLLSEQMSAGDTSGQDPEESSGRPIGGSYGKETLSTGNAAIKKARSYQALADLEKNGYFPAAPKPSAIGVQRGLKDSVVNDMCRAVVKHMVGDVYVNSSGQYGTKKVLNHLYEPVLQSVQNHFKRLPARYALSVNPDDVPMHMRLLARHARNPDEIVVNAQLKKDDDGNIVPNVCEVVVVSTDRDSLLDAITRALTSMKGSIMDADVMTTHDGVTLDRFVVKGMFMTEDRQMDLKNRIEKNIRQSSGEEEQEQTQRSSVTSQQTTGSDDGNLVEKLGVLRMVDQHEIKDEWKLNMSEIRLEVPIGKGRSGQTYCAWWRGTRVAAKLVDASGASGTVGEDLLNEFHREVAVVSKLRHPNVVLFLGAAMSPPRYCLVFEYMQNGTLTDLIRSRKSLIDFFRIAKEMAMGMNYLHLCSIMHRDLKSGNVLLDAYGTVKISDFGLSCVLEIGSSSDLTAETGTYRWMAPEVIRHEPYSNKADVYSYGVVLWEMIAKDQPFRGMTPIQAAFAVARQQMRPALPRYTPLKIGELVEHCWHQDPNRRPTFSDILEALPLVQMSLKKRDYKNLGFVQP